MTEEGATAAVAKTSTAIPAEDVKAASAKKGPVQMPEPVPRPDRNELNSKLSVIDKEIEEAKKILSDVKEKMDKLQAESQEKGKDSTRIKLNELRQATKVFSDQRKTLFKELDANKELTKKLRDESDKMQAQLKELAGFKGELSSAAVDKKIAELDYYMATTPLALKEEKDVIAKIKALTASKKVIGQFDSIQEKKDSATAARKALSAKLDENKKSFTQAKELEDAQWEIVKKNSSKDGDKRDLRKSLLEKRERARNALNDHYAKIRALRDEHKKAENAWRKYQDAKRKADEERYKKEQEERKEEEKLIKLEKEDEKVDSEHANSCATIEQLIKYLARYAPQDEKKDESKEEKDDGKAEMDGLQQIGKAARGFDDDIFGTKTKGGKKGKKGKGKKKNVSISHDVKSIEEFEALGISAPLSIEEVTKAVEELKKKRDELEEGHNKKKAERQVKIDKLKEEIEVKKAAKKAEEDAERAARKAAREEAASAEADGENAGDEAKDSEADKKADE